MALQGDLSSSHSSTVCAKRDGDLGPVAWPETCFLLCTGQETPRALCMGLVEVGLLPEQGGVPVALLPAWGPGGGCRSLAHMNCSWLSPGRAAGA